MHDYPLITSLAAAHNYPLITLLAAAFTAAWIFGLIAQRLGLSPIVGYLVAGIAIGKHTPGFVGDPDLAPQLAELGVMLLMFGVGLHFHLKDLLAVRKIAIPGAIGQSLMATVAGAVIFAAFDWRLSNGLVVGMAMAVASTVVLLRVLMDSNSLNTPAGHAAVGWLIVEDIITVLILVLIPAISPLPPNTVTEVAHTSTEAAQVVSAAGVGEQTIQATAHAAPTAHWAITLLKSIGMLLVFMAVVFIGGSRVVPWTLVQVARLRSRELFTLTVLVLSISVATGAYFLFGASVALGAFLAGMVVAQSPVSQQAGADALPMRDAFAVLFFVSVGMLFDPNIIIDEPLLVLAGLAIVLIVKPIAAILIVTILGYPFRTALTVAIGLAQIGEFSFIVGKLASTHNLMPAEGENLLVACAIVSITLNPVLFRMLPRIEAAFRRNPTLWKIVNGRSERRASESNAVAVQTLAEHSGPVSIIVGFGPVGRQVDRLLREAGREVVIIDMNMDVVSSLLAEGRTAIFGDATRAELLEQAGGARASHIILTTPVAADRNALISAAKSLNSDVRVLVRSRYLREEAEAMQMGAHATVIDEVESAVALVELVLAEAGANAKEIRNEAERVRYELSTPGSTSRSV